MTDQRPCSRLCRLVLLLLLLSFSTHALSLRTVPHYSPTNPPPNSPYPRPRRTQPPRQQTVKFPPRTIATALHSSPAASATWKEPSAPSRRRRRWWFRLGPTRAVRPMAFLSVTVLGLLLLLLLLLPPPPAAVTHAVGDNFRRLVEAYRTSLVTAPLRTNVVTGAVLAVVGDGVAQWNERQSYQPGRALSFATFDACYRAFQVGTFPSLTRSCQGAVLHRLWGFVGRSTTPSAWQAWAALEQAMVFQFIAIPLCYYPLFFLVTGLMQGLTVRATYDRARRSFWPCWTRNVAFWLPVQYAMFRFLPADWQIPFTCAVSVLWNAILSAVAGSARKGGGGVPSDKS